DRERHQYNNAEEKQHADRGAAADPPAETNVAPNQGCERTHADAPSRSSRAVIPSGWWVAATISPPSRKWSVIRAAMVVGPAASSAVVGSSSSHSGRFSATSRAIASRRRWPADRKAEGKWPRWLKPTASSALAGLD